MVIYFTSRSEAGLIKAQSLILSTNEPQHFRSGLGFVFDGGEYTNRSIEFSFPIYGGEKISRLTFPNEDTENYIDVYKDRFDFKNAPITVSAVNLVSNDHPTRVNTLSVNGDDLYIKAYDELRLIGDSSVSINATEIYINSNYIVMPSTGLNYTFPEKSGTLALAEDTGAFETISAMAEGGGPTTVELGKTKSGRLAFWINGSSNEELPFEILDSRGFSIYEFAIGERDEDEFLFEMFWYGLDVFFSAGGRKSHVDFGNYLTSIKIDMTGNRSSVVIRCSGYVMR